MSALRISACLIVRDEAARLAECLASVRPFVDELVVLDTGSTDGSPDIARAAGALVSSQAWIDDFAHARNAALSLCTGDWVLSLDADERVTGAPSWLPPMLAACGPELDALDVEITDANGPDARGLSAHREVKLLRRDRIRWAGRVHERPLLLDGWQPLTAALPVETLRLLHHGYADAEVARAKADRNARLCELELAELRATGGHPVEIARVALDLGRSQLAGNGRDLAEPSLRLARRAPAGSPVWLWATDFLIRLVLSERRLDEASRLVAELSQAGSPADYCRWLLAQVLVARGDIAPAAELLSRITELVDLSGNRLDLAQVRAAQQACTAQLAS